MRVFDEVLSYGELLLVSAASGLLAPLIEGARTGHELAKAFPELVRAGETNPRALSFRQSRHLESADAFRAWLSERRLSSEDFRGYLRRLVARAPGAAGGADGRPARAAAAQRPAGPALTATEAFAELAFTGSWSTFAKEAARLAAAERLDPGSGGGASGSLLDSLDLLSFLAPFPPHWCAERLATYEHRAAARARLERKIEGSDKVDQRLSQRHLDWSTLSFDELSLASPGAASEALLLARSEGLTAGEIARRSGGSVRRHRCGRDQLAGEVALLLDTTGEGEATGPLPGAGGASIYFLERREAPAPSDPSLRQRAAGELLIEALDDAAAGSVTALGPL